MTLHAVVYFGSIALAALYLNPALLGTIGSIRIQSVLSGTPDPADHFGLVAHGTIHSVVIRGTEVRLPFQIENVTVQANWK